MMRSPMLSPIPSPHLRFARATTVVIAMTLGMTLAGIIAGCASTQTPAALTQAQSIYASLESAHAEQRVEGDMIRTRASLDTAQTAVAQGQAQDFTDGIADIALRTAQTAEAHYARALALQAADSLQKLRLSRQLALAQSRQAVLEARQAALERQNALANARADSLRQAADAANAQLNSAMAQLQSLVVEITNLKETSRGLVISLSDILFDVGRATLKPGAEDNVRKISAVLGQYPDHKISVEGYTDATGNDAFNQQLSEDRAAAVRAVLVSGGVDAAMITSHGFGKANPVATNDTPEGRQQNRRVEVVVLGAGKLADVAAPRAPARGADAAAGSAGPAPADSIPRPAADTARHP